ncbi:transporter substrate-binding domain-containing protein [Advenella sp. EE-W14]|uniref:transporter substrate-binding domain-containing protein n=1 Tax=Advenella sp. EE-W14 TaxID=2722705 RepID=UPI00145D4718|nr:transporter substrate-binding domain-containing protein [Advenella sp. EE-W14]
MLRSFMKKRLLRQVVLATSSLLTAGYALTTHANSSAPLYKELPEAVKKAGKIHVAGDQLPPYRITAEDGRTMKGLEVELMQALQKQLGVPFETTVVANGPAIFTGVDTGRYDISFGPALATAEREKRYDVIPWLLSKPAFILPTQHGLKTEKILDLCGRRISVMSGSAAIREVEIMDGMCEKAGLKKTQQIVMPDQNSTLLAAQSGRADAFSMQYAAALHLLKTRPGEYTAQTDETNTLTTLRLGMILKNNSPLSPVMVTAMQNLVDNGEYQKILDNWGLAPASIDVIQLNPNSNKR